MHRQVSTAGSSFNTFLHVYADTTNELSGLRLLINGSNNDCASRDHTSCTTVHVTAGTNYAIQVRREVLSQFELGPAQCARSKTTALVVQPQWGCIQVGSLMRRTLPRQT